MELCTMSAKAYRNKKADKLSPMLTAILEILYKYRAIDANSCISENLLIQDLVKYGFNKSLNQMQHQIYILRMMIPPLAGRVTDEDVYKPICLTRSGLNWIKKYKSDQKKEQKAAAKLKASETKAAMEATKKV